MNMTKMTQRNRNLKGSEKDRTQVLTQIEAP